MLDIAIIVGLGLCCLLGVLLTALRLPGTWLITATALLYGWWTDWVVVGWVMIGALIGVAILGEAVELLASVLTARKAGASRQAAWGGLIGGILGMIFLSIPIFFPPIGTIFGALIGCFLGAAIAEYAVRKKLAQGTKVGFFSALGFILGTATKTALALLMAAILLTTVLWPEAEITPAKGEVSIVFLDRLARTV